LKDTAPRQRAVNPLLLQRGAFNGKSCQECPPLRALGICRIISWPSLGPVFIPRMPTLIPLARDEWFLRSSLTAWCVCVCVFSAGVVRATHALPLAGAHGRIPPVSGGANALQHAGGQDQPGRRLLAGGSS